MFKQILGMATMVGAAVSTALLTVTASGVTVDSADVTNISTANGYYLTSSFELLKFAGVIAVLAAGTWVLNKIFGIIPKASA